MQEPSERGSTAALAAAAGQEWLGNSVWQVPEIDSCDGPFAAGQVRPKQPETARVSSRLHGGKPVSNGSGR